MNQPANGSDHEFTITAPWSLRALHEAEERIIGLHREHNEKALAVAERLSDLMFAGLLLAIREPLQAMSDLAIRGMLTNAAKAYAKALDFALEGHYELALNLVRTLTENWVGVRYVMAKPETAPKFVNDFAQNSPSFATMLEVVIEDRALRAKFQPLRDGLNRFAHLTPVTWAGSMVWASDGHPMFAPGPRYDFKGFHYVLFPMLFVVGDLLSAIDSAIPFEHDDWRAQAEAIVPDVIVLKQTMLSLYGAWGGRPVPGGIWLESEIGPVGTAAPAASTSDED